MWRPLTRTSSLLDDPAAGTPSTRSREARRRGGPPTCPKPWHSLTSTNLGTRKWTQRKARTIQRKKRRLKLKTPKLKWGHKHGLGGAQNNPRTLQPSAHRLQPREKLKKTPLPPSSQQDRVFLPRLVINCVT